MDEFVKRLYDFRAIYRIFWSQNSNYRYFTDIYRYLPIFTDIFSEISAHAHVRKSLEIFPKYREFPIFRRFF